MGYEMMIKVRFYGLEKSLNAWSEVIFKRVGVKCHEVKNSKGRYFTDCRLSQSHLNAIQKFDWYSVSGMGKLANGQELRWNDCIAYEVKG